MTAIGSRSFDSPDESRLLDKTMVAVVRFDGVTAARPTFQSGGNGPSASSLSSERVVSGAQVYPCSGDEPGVPV
jgi:hypothetical protein